MRADPELIIVYTSVSHVVAYVEKMFYSSGIVNATIAHAISSNCFTPAGFYVYIKKNLAEFVPQNDAETAQLRKLWNSIVDRVKLNEQLTPGSESVPQKANLASFAIVG